MTYNVLMGTLNPTHSLTVDNVEWNDLHVYMLLDDVERCG